jgi:hypothetical protein
MPSSGAFARVGLIAAVSVVAGISTLGPLMKQATQSDSRTTGMAAAVPPPPDGRTTGVAAPLPPPPGAAGEGAVAAPPSDRSAPIAARALTGAVPEAARPPVRTAVARLTIDEAVRTAPPADIAPAAAAAPAPSAASGSAPPAVAASAFPAVQPLDETDGGASQAAQAAAPPQAAQAAAPPQAAQAAAPPQAAQAAPPQQAAKKKRAAAKKKPVRPAPFDLRDFFAGW